MAEGIFPEADWLKVGTGEVTGFMVEYKIPRTSVSISIDAGNKFWNMTDSEKEQTAISWAMTELYDRAYPDL